MRFLCDEMLTVLARWLRAAGYDADLAKPGEIDRALLQHARSEGRTLLTRDRAILQIKNASGAVLVLESENLDGWAWELKDKLGVDWLARPMSRCLVCNVDLIDADANALARMPEESRNRPGPFKTCPSCQRAYWPGSHVRRMMARLEGFAAFSGHPSSGHPPSGHTGPERP